MATAQVTSLVIGNLFELPQGIDVYEVVSATEDGIRGQIWCRHTYYAPSTITAGAYTFVRRLEQKQIDEHNMHREK